MPSVRGRAYYQREGAGFKPARQARYSSLVSRIFARAGKPALARPGHAIFPLARFKRLCRDRRSCLLDDGVKRGGLLDCKIGQYFPIDQNSGLAYAVDEATVGKAKRAHRCIETLNPESTECAFSPLAVAISVLVGLLDRLLGNANGILAPPVKSLRGLEDLLMFCVARDPALHARHGESPSADCVQTQVRFRSAVRQEGLFDGLSVGLEQHARATQLPNLLVGTFDHPVALPGVLVEHLAAAGHFESLLGPGFCFDFGHLALLCGSTMPLPAGGPGLLVRAAADCCAVAAAALMAGQREARGFMADVSADYNRRARCGLSRSGVTMCPRLLRWVRPYNSAACSRLARLTHATTSFFRSVSGEPGP